jgi:hypothetical protein
MKTNKQKVLDALNIKLELIADKLRESDEIINAEEEINNRIGESYNALYERIRTLKKEINSNIPSQKETNEAS